MSEQVTEAQVKEIEAAVQAHVNNWSSRGFSTPLATSCAALCASWRARGEEIADLRARLAAAESERDRLREWKFLVASPAGGVALERLQDGEAIAPIVESWRKANATLTAERDGCAANLAVAEGQIAKLRAELANAEYEIRQHESAADTARRELAEARVELADWQTLRPEVQAFAQAMETQLRANDHKGGWKDCTRDYLMTCLVDEVSELRAEAYGRTFSWYSLEPKPEKVRAEAADVANFAMMIADVLGGLVSKGE